MAMSPLAQRIPYQGVEDMTFDAYKIRKDFPVLSQKMNGKKLVYLDSAATSQKPQSVIDAISYYYHSKNANIHRGIYQLSEEATAAYEATRAKVASFINAADPREIVFVRGTTEAINLVAQTFGRKNILKDDEIIISTLEHHSNIVPWQMLCEETGAKLKVIPISDDGELLLDEYKKLLNEKTKLVAINHISNSLGTLNLVKAIIREAHQWEVPVLVDGAQAVPHTKVNVQDLDADFYAFSGHKLFGPTGIGVLYGKAELLEDMPPYQGGGDMILKVTFEKTLYNKIPHKFEAGTPHIAGVVGLGKAIDYLSKINFNAATVYEQKLLTYATHRLLEIKELHIIGKSLEKASVISFILDGIHPHDIGTILDKEGIAIRAGHHCNMPLMQRLGLTATARASMAFYNTKEDIDALAEGIQKVLKVFR